MLDILKISKERGVVNKVGGAVQARGIKNHFHDTVHVKVCRHKCPNIYPKA
jgi:hypothetical protein